MNKNRKMKQKIAASVAVGMSVMMGVTQLSRQVELQTVMYIKKKQYT